MSVATVDGSNNRKLQQLLWMAAVPFIVAVAIGSIFFPQLLLVLIGLGMLIIIADGRYVHAAAFIFLIVIQLQNWFAVLAFQYVPALTNWINRFEEVAALFWCFLILMAKCLRPGKIKILGTPFDTPLILFFLFCLLSGMVNGNPPFITLLGTHDMLKNFLFFYIFRALCFSREQFVQYSKYYFWFAMVVCGIGLIELCLPLEFTQLFGIGVDDYRFGIKRITSVLENPHSIANVLLPVIVYLVFLKGSFKHKKLALFIILTVFMVTFSRQYWLAVLIVGAGIIFFDSSIKNKMKKMLIVAGVLIGFTVAIVAIMYITGTQNSRFTFLPKDLDSYFRFYAMMKSFEIWADYPWFGVGPGRFGGFVSTLFYSPIYAKYNFDWFGMGLNQIDLYWPQVWTEVGIFGLIFYGGALYGFYSLLKRTYLFFLPRDKDMTNYTVVAIGTYLVILLAGFASPAFSSAQQTIICFALAGSLYSIYEKDAEKNNKS